MISPWGGDAVTTVTDDDDDDNKHWEGGEDKPGIIRLHPLDHEVSFSPYFKVRCFT